MHMPSYRFVSIIYLYVYAPSVYREVRGMFFFHTEFRRDKHNKGYKKYLEKKLFLHTTVVAAGVRFIIKTKGNNDNDDCIERTRVPSTTDHNNIGI
jgi:hypothetical protein